MGVGSENKGKDLLRQADTSGSISNRPQFKANNMQKSVGIDDSETSSGGGTSGGGSGGGGHSWGDEGTGGKTGGDAGGGGHDWGDSGQEDEKPIPLRIPGTYKDYVNQEDYKNLPDYYDAIKEHAKVYIDNGDQEGLDEFIYENNILKDFVFKSSIENYFINGGKLKRQDVISAASPNLKYYTPDTENEDGTQNPILEFLFPGSAERSNLAWNEPNFASMINNVEIAPVLN